jgi:lysozyme family protein
MITTLIARLIDREGGFVYHKADRGGPTKYGVTQKTLSAYRGYPVTAAAVEALSKAEAHSLYLAMFWEEPGFDSLNIPTILTEMIFDAGVHHGPGTAVKILQHAVGTKRDGDLGPKTYAATQDQEPEMLAARFMGARVEYIGKIITRDPTQAVFAHGWMSRMREFITAIPAVVV